MDKHTHTWATIGFVFASWTECTGCPARLDEEGVIYNVPEKRRRRRRKRTRKVRG